MQMELLQSMRNFHKLKQKVRFRGLFGGEVAMMGIIARTREVSSDGLVRVSDIVQEMQIPASGVSRGLGDLERRGMVVREADPKDRRSTLVQITPEGEAQLAEQRTGMKDFLDRLIAKMGEEKVQQFTDLMNEMNRDIEELFEECEAARTGSEDLAGKKKAGSEDLAGKKKAGGEDPAGRKLQQKGKSERRDG